MTQLPLKGNPISFGDAWRSGTPPVASDSCVTVLTLLYIAHSTAFNASVQPQHSEMESPGQSDVPEAGEVSLGWKEGRWWLLSAVFCTAPMAQDGLAIRSRIPLCLRAMCCRGKTPSHPTQDPF